ncbi:coiled-coil domain-containing protein 73-like [Periophthalmus magnuspinnatus]|uniref:coiled-coil domain-containing protein 73-like n=1 Tax=Periophthalmus magnuspinnatus TaxID=409849 RepID=UPI002436F740|nr:coiled-coil domain-containing protein 73-like [Periophthalmus magnuspinnatus]
MDVCKELTHLSSSITAAGPECGQGLSLPDLYMSDGNVFLQLLEFKAHLLEVVEELHIRRDADKRFEEQITKLVLEKQELEWEKESLQHQMGSEKNQYAESLSKANKQSRYQLSAEQKEKNIHNLKEELKSLQLTKYNLEKKSSELEQKLALQSRSKDSRLNQLSEVEKRFSALARQCSMVKQAHDKLEQNVDEAVKLNKKLTSTNEKQEVNIASLNKEVEELRNKLVKTKMAFVNPDKRKDNLSIKVQTLNHLHQKLNMECEMNRKFKDENKALQAEKQEVLTSLQLAHQLLSKQTQTLSQLELDLETQRKQYQSLKQDHKAMQVKEKTVEEKIKQLMEEYSVSKSNWDKEKAGFLNQINNEQQELMTVKEAYEELHQNRMELSSKAKEQAQQIHELKVKVKELDLTVIPSKSTKEGGSSESSSRIELSSSVHTLTLAKDSDEPKDKWVSIIRGGQAVFNKGYMSETVLESKIYSTNNNNNSPSAAILSEDMTEHTNNCTMNEVPAHVVVSSVFRSGTAQTNSSAILSNGFNSANTSLKLITESLFQGDDGAINKADIVAMEEKNGHEDTKEKKAEESENSLKEQAQMTDLNEASVTVEDAMVVTLNLIAESVDEDHARGETFGVVESEQQSQMTEEENQLHVSKDTRNNTQVSPNKPKSALQGTVNEKVDQALPIQETTRQEVLPGDLMESQVCEPINDVQNASPLVESPPLSVCHDLEENAGIVSEESTTAELPQTLNKSSSCQSQSDAAQLASVSDQETIKMQTQTVSPPDTPGHTEDTVDKSAKECSPVSEMVKHVIHFVSQKEIFEEKNNLTDSVSNNLTNDCEKKGENEQVDIMDKSTVKCKQSDVDQMNTDIVISWDEFGSSQKLSKITTKATMHWPRESDLKSDSPISQFSSVSEFQKNPLTKEAKMIEFAGPFKTTYKPLFQWGSAQRRAPTFNAKSDMLPHSALYNTSQMSNTSGYNGNSSNTVSLFHRSKHNKAPLTITRATGLLTASSVCGTSASSRRPQQTEWRTLAEAHRDTAEGQMDGRFSLSEASSLVCTSSGTVSRTQTQIRTLSPDASRSPESELGLSCSQGTEEQQSSFRVQISKIEQFLNTERLRLPKRRKTEN